jgi:hypothetical protein
MSGIEQRFYTTEEAAELSRFTLAGLASRRHRQLPPEWLKIGGKVVYPIDEFELWLLGESGGDDTEDTDSAELGG